MEPYTQDVIRIGARQYKKDLGHDHLGKMSDHLQTLATDACLAALLEIIDTTIGKCFDSYVYDHHLHRDVLRLISEPALEYLATRFHLIAQREARGEEAIFIDCLKKILQAHNKMSADFKTGQSILAPIWKSSAQGGGSSVQSGFYQLFRREKPLSKTVGEDLHEISAELVFIDSERVTATLFSATHAVYIGSLHINAIRILHIMFVRHSQREAGPAFRTLYMPKCDESPFNTCVMLMDGLITGRPLSSDCVIIYLNEDEHARLYDEFRDQDWDIQSTVEEGAVISDYLINGSLPELRKRGGRKSKYLSHFPLLKFMVDNPLGARNFFREPTRCLVVDTMEDLFSCAQLYPFQWSKELL